MVIRDRPSRMSFRCSRGVVGVFTQFCRIALLCDWSQPLSSRSMYSIHAPSRNSPCLWSCCLMHIVALCISNHFSHCDCVQGAIYRRFKRILPCVGEFRPLGLVKRHQFGSMYCTFGGYTHPFMEVLMIQVKSSLAANMVIQ